MTPAQLYDLGLADLRRPCVCHGSGEDRWGRVCRRCGGFGAVEVETAAAEALGRSICALSASEDVTNCYTGTQELSP